MNLSLITPSPVFFYIIIFFIMKLLCRVCVCVCLVMFNVYKISVNNELYFWSNCSYSLKEEKQICVWLFKKRLGSRSAPSQRETGKASRGSL